MRFVSKKPTVQILRLGRVPLIDASALHALKRFYKACQKRQVKLIVCGLQPQPLKAVKESGLCDTIGKENFVSNVHTALQHAELFLKS